MSNGEREALVFAIETLTICVPSCGLPISTISRRVVDGVRTSPKIPRIPLGLGLPCLDRS
jgi:hypothetical protein